MDTARALSGTVLDIDRFSTHDGPGIRTAIFLKGCPLACRWCHSPESQNPEPELLYQPSGTRVAGERRTVEELMAVIRQDAAFYRHSGGGVTVSGGEPLMQAAFAGALLGACRREGIHTGVETSGFGETNALLAIAGVCDLIYYDVKLLDEEEHRAYTGRGNRLILDNLAALCGEHAGRVTVRLSCIPGVNDRPAHIEAVARHVKELGIRRMELLPYNAAAPAKYRWVKRPYPLGEIAPRTAKEYEELSAILMQCGLNQEVHHGSND